MSSPTTNSSAALRSVKIAHSVVWAWFAGCIVLLPWFAWRRQLAIALVLITRHFDIYLPLWIARYNKLIFGWLFVAGIIFTIIQWSRG